MSTRMDQKLYERRVECLKYHSKGVAPSVWTEDLSKKYGVKAKTIWRDWNRREQWLQVIVNMKNPEVVLAECLAESNEVKKAAWGLFYSSECDNARVGALKVIDDNIDRRLDLAGYGRSLKIEGEVVTRPKIVVEMWRGHKDADVSRE